MSCLENELARFCLVFYNRVKSTHIATVCGSVVSLNLMFTFPPEDIIVLKKMQGTLSLEEEFVRVVFVRFCLLRVLSDICPIPNRRR